MDNKREKRKKALRKKPEKVKALRHEEIMERLRGVKKEIVGLERDMKADQTMRGKTKASDDPLDAFMKQARLRSINLIPFLNDPLLVM